MANVYVAHPNHFDSTFYTVVLSGGSWLGSLPLTNLKDPQLGKVARSTDATLASTQFDVDWGILRSCRLFALPKNNLSKSALVRVRLSNTAGDFSSPIYDTGWVDAWPVIYPHGSIDWEHPSFWDGKLDGESAQDYDPHFIHVASQSFNARYARWEIDDTTNPDGYVELARGFCSPGWQPTTNMDQGAALGVTTDTAVRKSLGGVKYFRREKPRRVIRFTISAIDQDEALANAFEMQRRQGIDRQVFIIWDADDTENLHRMSFLATLRELTPLEFPFSGHASVPFQAEEVL